MMMNCEGVQGTLPWQDSPDKGRWEFFVYTKTPKLATTSEQHFWYQYGVTML